LESEYFVASSRKVKLTAHVTQVPVKIVTVLGAIAVAVLFFFALVFALAASVQETLTRLAVSGLLFVMGIAIAYYITRKPKTVIQRLEVSGQMAAASIRCPNCGASVDANLVKIVSGVPYATCPYCGTTFEVTEEPKW
jgi:DNA-directed RNA polymerase subunit RPC12/RpoP